MSDVTEATRDIAASERFSNAFGTAAVRHTPVITGVNILSLKESLLDAGLSQTPAEVFGTLVKAEVERQGNRNTMIDFVTSTPMERSTAQLLDRAISRAGR